MRRVTLPALALLLLSTASVWAQQSAAAAPSAATQDITLRQIIVWGGLWFMIPLGILSVFTMTLVIYFFFALRKKNIISLTYVSSAKRLISVRDITALAGLSRETDDVASKVVGAAARICLDDPTAPREVVREAAEAEGTRQSTNLMQTISYLNDIAVISPLIGLLGTVVGLIKSFSVLAGDVGAGKALALAGGISQALVCTAAGLCIAIPSMAFYAYFRARVQKFITELEATTAELVGRLCGTKP